MFAWARCLRGFIFSSSSSIQLIKYFDILIFFLFQGKVWGEETEKLRNDLIKNDLPFSKSGKEPKILKMSLTTLILNTNSNHIFFIEDLFAKRYVVVGGGEGYLFFFEIKVSYLTKIKLWKFLPVQVNLLIAKTLYQNLILFFTFFTFMVVFRIFCRHL